MAAPDLSHVETWIFDLDNTLYSASTEVFGQIGTRMTEFIAKKYGLDTKAAGELRGAYYRSHGTTLSGLMELRGQDPQEFLSYVHDIDLTPLRPRPELAAALARLPGRRLVHTNGSRAHAERVMERLGVLALFAAIHDIADADYCPKPHRAAYEALLVAHDIGATRAAMFEDLARNLEVPHTLGMTTILVEGHHDEAQPDGASASAPHIHHVAHDLADFLNTAQLKLSEAI
jgi:putative hydrolase of the HAD superfamily